MVQKTEMVRNFYAALAQGDFETVGAMLSNDLVWHQPGHGVLSGVYTGKSDVFTHLGRMAQWSNGTFAIDQVGYITENGDLVAAAIGFGATANGLSMKMKGIDLFRFEGDLIREVWLFSEHGEEEDRFWATLAQKQ